MIDMIYEFILNTLLGNPEFSGAETMAMLLTYTTIILCFALLIKLMMWAFGIVFKWTKIRK